MRKPRPGAVYNSRIPEMQISLPFDRVQRRLLRLALPFLLMVFPCVSDLCVFGADWNAPEQQLAQKIAAATGPGAMAFDIVNRSSLTNKDVGEINSGLRAQLNALGVQ